LTVTERHSVIEMKRTGSVFSLGSEFDDFLLAPIGDDNNGMQLTVLSALARLDVDPWEEAAALARLPRGAATSKLASRIAALPAGPSARPDPRTIAGRLIPLLPRPVAPNVPPGSALPSSGAVTRFPILTYLILYGLSMLLMLAVQWLVASPQVPAQANSVPTPPAHVASPQSPPPSSAD
jgi:hypothetical protein